MFSGELSAFGEAVLVGDSVRIDGVGSLVAGSEGNDRIGFCAISCHCIVKK